MTATARSGVTKPNREILCRERERKADGVVSLELRVEHNGQVFRTETHSEGLGFYRRVKELRAMLEAEGWVLTE